MITRNLTLKARDWHGWLSVILLVPLLLVGLTAFFIAHSKSLGLKDIDVSRLAGWLPGYRTASTAAPENDLRVALTLTDGTQWLGTRNGVFELVPGRSPVAHLSGQEVRALVAGPDALLAATRGGLWRRDSGGDWQKVAGGEFWSASRNSDGTLNASSREKGLLHSTDGRRWQPVELPELPAPAGGERLSLGKLMLDLHTGKAFFGKDGEWIWIDLLAAVWAFLGGTGLYLWWRTQTKRRDAALQRSGTPT